MRLPQAAPQERTKTIAVASHCPEDMYAQAWSIDDFVLLRKLYEGALSVVCHAQHKRSGRHVALKVRGVGLGGLMDAVNAVGAGVVKLGPWGWWICV